MYILILYRYIFVLTFSIFFSGKPAPRVVWYRNNRIYSAASAKSNNGLNLVTVNNITLDSLGREDVHTKLTCQTSNFEATTLRTSVELDMKCTYLKTILFSAEYRVTQIRLDYMKYVPCTLFILKGLVK